MKKCLLAVLPIFLPLLAQAQANSAGIPKGAESVPYVGCTGTDFSGANVAPPPGHPIALDIPSAIAAKLAFYYGQNLFVLAPRGWECSSVELPNGGDASLVVTPHGGAGRSGPVVDLDITDDADTENFKVIAFGGTYFPKRITSQSVDSLIDELNGRGANITRALFLVPKYQEDRLAYLDDSVLEYRTPSEKMGLGVAILHGGYPQDISSDPNLLKSLSNLPTFGMLGLVNFPDYAGSYYLTLLALRLPPGLAALSPTIQDFTAHCQPLDQTAACASQMDFGQ